MFLFSKKIRFILIVLAILLVCFFVSLKNGHAAVLAPDCDDNTTQTYNTNDTLSGGAVVSTSTSSSSKSYYSLSSSETTTGYLSKIQNVDFYAANGLSEFQKFLGVYYKSYADYLRDYIKDPQEGEHFANKAWLAYNRQTPVVDSFNVRRIDKNEIVDLDLAMRDFQNAMNASVYTQFPMDMAYAQVSLDCWMERQSKGAPYPQIASCKRDFYEKMKVISGTQTDLICDCVDDSCDQNQQAPAPKKDAIIAPNWVLPAVVQAPKPQQINIKLEIQQKEAVAPKPVVIEKKVEVVKPDPQIIRLQNQITELQKTILIEKQTPKPVIVKTPAVVAPVLIKQVVPSISVEDKDYSGLLLKRTTEKKALVLSKTEQFTRTDIAQNIVFPLELYFDWDKSLIKNQYQFVINDVAEFVKANNVKSLIIEGYADTSGSRDYNKKLSMRRAKSIKAALAKQGANVSVKLVSMGQDNLKVQTGDGVKNPENRRGIIKLGSGGAQNLTY